VAAIVLGYAFLHSALASRPAKEAAERLLGARVRDGLYRPVYNAHAIALFAWAACAFAGLPDRALYRVLAPWSWAMYGAQIAGVGLAAWAVVPVGIRRMSGLTSVAALLRGAKPERAPEAQGPALGMDGELLVRGPFRLTRHPANWGLLLVVLFIPRMTVNRATLAVLSAAYLVAGSVHEEFRLRAAYSVAYERFRRRVPFLVGAAGSSRRRSAPG
jgi:hypothetical protein